MTTEQRNELFVKHQNLISMTVRRNRRLIAALRLESDDVAQDLSIKMLWAIEKYNPERSNSIEAYITVQLQYAILDMKRRHKPHGMTVVGQDIRPEYVNIDERNAYGTVFEIPSYDDTSVVELAEVLTGISSDERDALKRKLAGYFTRKKQQTDALARVKEKFALYCNDEYTNERSFAA